MKTKNITTLTCAAVAALALSTPASHAAMIFIGLEGGSGDVDNVLFDNDVPTTLLTAETNSGNSLVDFTSMSGDGQMQASAAGQASILGAGTNVPLTNLMFDLQNDETFTKAQFNPLGATDGEITISVDYFNSCGVLSNISGVFDLDDNGQNFFTVLADTDEALTKVTLTSDAGFESVRQVRIGGIGTTASVPDGGATVMLFGFSLLALESLRRRFHGRSSTAV